MATNNESNDVAPGAPTPYSEHGLQAVQWMLPDPKPFEDAIAGALFAVFIFANTQLTAFEAIDAQPELSEAMQLELLHRDRRFIGLMAVRADCSCKSEFLFPMQPDEAEAIARVFVAHVAGRIATLPGGFPNAAEA